MIIWVLGIQFEQFIKFSYSNPIIFNNIDLILFNLQQEINEKHMTLDERLKIFNEYFHYKERPELHEFEISPEKIAYRNEALRSGDRNLYLKYLTEKYADKLEKEMERYDLAAQNLVKVDRDSANELFNSFQVNMLKSDISFLDNDAIYTMYKVSPESIELLLEGYREDLIDVFVPINEVFQNGRKEIYLDKTGIYAN